MPVQVRAIHARDSLDQPVTQPAQAGRLIAHAVEGDGDGRPEADDRRHILRPRAAVALMRPSVLDAREVRPFSYIQCTDALGSIPDRKSTRLNSSHRCISYAVFC